jgi:hypothetical protein
MQLWWQKVVEAIEGQEASQDTILNNLKRNFSHTEPTTIFVATENGATATITISDHVRVYGDSTRLNVTGGSIAGLACDTPVAVYYDDLTLTEVAPDYVATTVIKDAQTIAAAGRHFCGVIRTPAATSGAVRDGGGVYPAGSNIGGEIA